jgi:hypothetical protein
MARRGVYVAVAAGLLVVAAAATPETFAWLQTQEPRRVVLPDPPVLFDYLLLAMGALALASLLFVRVSLLRERQPRSLSNRASRLAILLLVVAAWAFLPPVQRALERSLEAIDVGGQSDRRPAGGDRNGPESSRPLGYVVTLLAALALGGAAAGLVWATRPERAASPQAVPEKEVLAGLDAGIGDLEAIAEPRAAVLSCYARMQAAADGAGVDRRPSDAPFELLAKLLERRGMGEVSARRLTELFEVARFSRLEIDETMRVEALDALRGVRDELAAAGR